MKSKQFKRPDVSLRACVLEAPVAGRVAAKGRTQSNDTDKNGPRESALLGYTNKLAQH